MSESSQPNRNESVAEVLARMQEELNFQMPEDGPQLATGTAQENSPQAPIQQEPAPTQAPTQLASPPKTSQPAPEPSVSSGQGQEEDMEQMTDYMGSLLERYGTTTDSAPAKPAKPNSSEDEPMKIGETCEVPNLLSACEYKPENTAPEKKDNIAVMRELAVHSARKAIQVSAKKKRQSDATLRKVLAGGTALVGVGSLLLAWGQINFLSILGAAGICASSYFFLQIKKFDIDSTQR